MDSGKVINIFIIGLSLFASCCANNNLQIKYEWKAIDFKYQNETLRSAAISSQAFIPANVIPTGLDVHENRLFLSLPRLKRGVPASLAYINMEELSENNAPALKPYPSWQSHQTVNENDQPDIVSPFHIKVDRCNRLWALDTGIESQLDEKAFKRILPARILIFDLRTDDFIRKYTLPEYIKFEGSIFSNIAVDDNDCEDTFAYVSDASTPPSLTVYSFKSNEAWQVKHNFFNIDPLAGNFSVLGVNFRTNDGLYGLALTEKKENGFPDLFFHSLTSHSEFNVSTSILRNKAINESSSPFYKDFNLIGNRDTNEQAGSSIYDVSNKVVFYTLPNMNEIACWKTDKNYSVSNVFTSHVKMVFPIDIKIDSKERIWVLSNNMQQFLNGQLNVERDTNFFVHFVPIKEAIKNTPCEPGFIENVVNKFNKALRPDGKGGAATTKPAALIACIASIVLSIKHLF